MLYDPQNPAYFGQRTEKDPFDGKLYIPDCISWFIKEVVLHQIRVLLNLVWRLIAV